MNNIEIRRVANGYYVVPVYGMERQHLALSPDDVHVFETFEALVKFLAKTFGVKTLLEPIFAHDNEAK